MCLQRSTSSRPRSIVANLASSQERGSVAIACQATPGRSSLKEWIHGRGRGIVPINRPGGAAMPPTRARSHTGEVDRSHQRDASAARRLSCIRPDSKKNAPKGVAVVALVDLRGIEPLTSSMPRKLPRAGDPSSFRPRSSGIRCHGSRAGTPGRKSSLGHVLPARQFPDSPVLCDAVQLATMEMPAFGARSRATDPMPATCRRPAR